jgi:hypothetical protein
MSNKCCNECNQPKSSVCSCNLSWVNNTTVEQVDPNSYTVSSPFYDVISSDNSIDVQTNVEWNTITFDIQKDCCPDKLVWACDSDTNPWTLFNNKLRVDTTWPLTYNLVNCPWDAYVEIGFNENALNPADNKVAAWPWCASGFLNEVLESNSTYFNFTVVPWCKYQLQPQPRTLFRAELWVNNPNVKNLDGGITIATFLESVQHNTTIASAVVNHSLWLLEPSTKKVVIPRTWWYHLGLHGACITNGVHSLRNQLVYADTLSPLLDSRFEWGWREDLNATDTIDTQAELNQEINGNAILDIASANGEEIALSYAMRWLAFGASKTTYLTEGTEIMFACKYNTIVKNEFATNLNHSIVFMGRWTDVYTNGEWAGTGRYIHELPTTTLSD